MERGEGVMNNELFHYGIPRRSGRYPYGSGNRPFQSQEKQKTRKHDVILKTTGRNVDPNKLVSLNKIDQNKPLMKKAGETVQHISGVNIDKLKPGQLYITATDYDNKLYETFLSAMLKVKDWSPKKVELQLKEDLNTPSSKEQKQVFKTVLENNREEVVNDISKWMVDKKKVKTIENGKEFLSSKKESELYDIFINSCEQKSNSRILFYEKLKDMGYNSVLDEHDRFSWIGGRHPIIIMEVMDTIGDFKISDVNANDIAKSLDDWLKLNK